MEETNKPKIMIIGGHLTPALAVLEELKARGYDNFVWVGRKYSQEGDKRKSSEYKLIKELGVRFYDLNGGRLQRKWTLKTFVVGVKELGLVPLGLFRASSIIKKENPDLIMSFGGYLAVPVVMWGKLMGKKVITHEQTVVSGLANRMIGKYADKVLISWDESARFFPKNKTVKTGNPIRREIFEVSTNDFNFENELPVTYVTGGSQGSNTINWRLLEILPRLLKSTNIIHQTGSSTVTKDYEKALKTKKRLPGKLKDRYIIKEHIYGKQIGEVFDKSALVVSRAGANTVTELLALAQPAILVPIPWSSQSEQTKNAVMLEKLGIATVLDQITLTPDILYEAIKSAINNYTVNLAPNGESLDTVKARAQGKVNPDAAKSIVDEIEKLLS